MEQKIFCVNSYYETKSFKIVQARYRKKVQFQHISKQESNFQIGLKLMALVKIIGQWVPHHFGL